MVDGYISARGLPSIDIELALSDNLFESRLNFSADNQRDHILENKDTIESSNGTVAWPEFIDGKYYIIVSKSYIDRCIREGGVDYLETMYHELQHAFDHKRYLELINSNEFASVPKRHDYDIFTQWTEFNASRWGCLGLWKYAYGEIYTSQCVADHIVNIIFPNSIENWVIGYSSTSDAKQQLYVTMRFLGRLKALKDLYPEIFSNDYVCKIFDTNIWAYNLFIFLDEKNTLDSSFLSFDKLRDILKSNWTFA